VGAVIFRGEEFLLVRRGQEPAKGAWSLPGLGVTAVLERIYRDDDHNIPYHYVLIDFACDYVAGEPRPGSDVTAARFVSLRRLPEISLASFTVQVVRRAFEQRKTGAFLPLLG